MLQHKGKNPLLPIHMYRSKTDIKAIIVIFQAL